MELNLAGRTALITGGSKGIGLGTAHRFASEGVNLILVARSGEQLETAAAVVRQRADVTVECMALDLAREADRVRLVHRFPEIDILVNNAGAVPAGSIEEVDDATWRAAWDLKVFGYINLTRAYFTRMKAQGRGVILNVIGAGGEKLDGASYLAGATGNAALMAFSRALGGASTDFNVRVIGVNPGAIDTDRVTLFAKKLARERFGDESRWRESFARLPFNRPGTVDEVAAMLVFLASDLCGYVTGTIITIDGGHANRNSTMA
jgi:NAD(P)-dependent dehydrogenase (short-subunit alcohol dehydrogenase family)